jgi:hypothetical protein
MKAPFLGQAYASRSKILANQTAINLYPESSEGNTDKIGAFIGTPGLTTKYTGAGEVRGIHSAGGFLFAVIGNTVWRLTSSYAATNLGILPNSSGPVSMVHNESQLAIAHTSGWHWVTFSGAAIAAVAGSPAGSVLTYQDQYVLYTDVNGLFGLTALADLSTLSALDVADAEGAPDDLISIISDHREAWLFGTESTEIWSNTGASFFPFERAPGGFIEQGCAAKFSPAKLDNSVFWLGVDRNGQGIVYRSNTYIPQRISTHAIEYAINQYSTIADAIGWSYQEEGHNFYCLAFPTGNATWVYDTAAQGWHQRGWLDANGLVNRHRANCYATFNGKHVIGDWQNGNIYEMSLDVYYDAGDEIYRERAFVLPDTENNKSRIDTLELMAAQGDGSDSIQSKVWLQVSRDNGQNWGYQRLINMGAIGQTMARLRWRRLGTGRNIACRLATTMGKKVQWQSVMVDGEVYAK